MAAGHRDVVPRPEPSGLPHNGDLCARTCGQRPPAADGSDAAVGARRRTPPDGLRGFPARRYFDVAVRGEAVRPRYYAGTCSGGSLSGRLGGRLRVAARTKDVTIHTLSTPPAGLTNEGSCFDVACIELARLHAGRNPHQDEIKGAKMADVVGRHESPTR